MAFNCPDTNDYDRKTLAEMRAGVMQALGFIDPLTADTSCLRTLADLRAEVLDTLGLATPTTQSTFQVLPMLREMARMVGMGAMIDTSGFPPGFKEMCLSFLNKAQGAIFRRLELDKGAATPPTQLFSDVAFITDVDPDLLLTVAVGMLKAHLQQPDANTYREMAEKQFADYVQRRPPNITQMVNRALQSAHRTVVRRFESGSSGTLTDATFTADGDFTAIDAQPVLLLALANLKAKIGQGDAKAYMQEYETSMADQLKRSPPNAPSVINRAVQTAQEELYRRYHVFRMERFYTWTLVAGERYYGIGSNDEQTDAPPVLRKLDPRQVTWVGVSQGDNSWRPLRKGIPPGLYASPQSGVPTHYEVRQCIEVWPGPVDGWQLRIKGFFGLDPFLVDSDLTTIDWQAIHLQAVAIAKASYNQPDKREAALDAERYVGDLVAGSHMTARYVPGSREPVNAVRPVLVP